MPLQEQKIEHNNFAEPLKGSYVMATELSFIKLSTSSFYFPVKLCQKVMKLINTNKDHKLYPQINQKIRKGGRGGKWAFLKKTSNHLIGFLRLKVQLSKSLFSQNFSCFPAIKFILLLFFSSKMIMGKSL
jgi:hypothetical protein